MLDFVPTLLAGAVTAVRITVMASVLAFFLALEAGL